MGFLNRWLDRFLSTSPGSVEPATRALSPSDSPGASSSAGRSVAAQPVSSASELPRPAPERTSSVDPLQASLQKARARLTLDDSGKRYAESDAFLAELASLDAGARSRAADALLADALLVTPSLALRRRLAERLLFRGDREQAQGLLSQLTAHDDHASFAWMALGESAEYKGDAQDALRCYERVLARDIYQANAKARVARLRSGQESRHGTLEGRSMLTRFLGARAAGSRYAVLEEIGRGGAATVFRARDRVVEREVALKIFHPRGRTTERRARILREARIAGGFDHPHIVPILDIDEARDLLVMLLCDGGSLRQRLTHERMRTSDIVDMGAVLLRTLRDIHAQGRLHLDIKPSNLLFHERRLMLCDFGTAGLLELGTAAGTRAYMAPEQRRAEKVGAPADVYAAGLVLFECIEGHLPSMQQGAEASFSLLSLPEGPRRRALERLLTQLCREHPEERRADLGHAAEELLEAAALPAHDADGERLWAKLEHHAQQTGAEASARLKQHPISQLLKRPA